MNIPTAPAESSRYIAALNLSSVTFVGDLSRYWEGMTGPGFEVASPSGEIRAFRTREVAEVWRRAEVAAYVALSEARA